MPSDFDGDERSLQFGVSVVGTGIFRRARRWAPVTVRLKQEFWSLAENGPPGRIRSDAEAAAIPRRYAASDWWRLKSSAEKLVALRKARAAVAARDRCAESAVSREALVKHLGLRPSDVPNGFWWSMAGDFVPKRR